jgi:hypothetical protein
MGNAAFFCDVKAMTKSERERYKQLREKLEGAMDEAKELENGYAFRWPSDRVDLMELAEWVEKERRCCPFFDFEMAFERERGPVWLKMTGREGVKTFLRMEFGAAIWERRKV